LLGSVWEKASVENFSSSAQSSSMHSFSIFNHYFLDLPQYWTPKSLLLPIHTRRISFAVLHYFACSHDEEYEDVSLSRYCLVVY
jgi:hypothetical protein